MIPRPKRSAQSGRLGRVLGRLVLPGVLIGSAVGTQATAATRPTFTVHLAADLSDSDRATLEDEVRALDNSLQFVDVRLEQASMGADIWDLSVTTHIGNGVLLRGYVSNAYARSGEVRAHCRQCQDADRRAVLQGLFYDILTRTLFDPEKGLYPRFGITECTITLRYVEILPEARSGHRLLHDLEPPGIEQTLEFALRKESDIASEQAHGVLVFDQEPFGAQGRDFRFTIKADAPLLVDRCRRGEDLDLVLVTRLVQPPRAYEHDSGRFDNPAGAREPE